MLPPPVPGQRQTWRRRLVKVARSPLVTALLLAAACGRPPSPVEQAVVLSQKGQDRQAIELLRAHLAGHPAATSERRLLVRLLGVTGDLGAAESAAAELAARLPADSPIPWVELGHAMEIAHRYEQALALYDRAASVAPRDPLGPRTGGLRAARWGEISLAGPRLEEALRRDPRDATVWHALGLVRLHAGNLDGARTAYESGLVADPAALENRVGLATVALKAGDPERALQQYDRLLAERPGFAEGHLGRAWALAALGRRDAAIAALAEARRRGADAHAIDLQERRLRGPGENPPSSPPKNHESPRNP
jgi:protein O-GlcNAc transferase